MFTQPPHPKIVLISDDANEKTLLQELPEGHAVLDWVGSLSELRASLRNSEYDVVLCPWICGAGSWEDVLNVRREESLEIPVIVLSRVGAEPEWLRAIDAGAFDFLAAPFRKDSLLAVLEQATASRKGRLRHAAGSRRSDTESSGVSRALALFPARGIQWFRWKALQLR